DSKVTGVKFTDTVTGEEFIQPAEIVALTSYVFNNYKLLAVSDIGEQYDPETEEGTLGKNYSYQLHSGATGFFEEKKFNTFMGAGALGMALDDYNGDNFDHTDLDFIHGGLIDQLQMGARPILNNTVKGDTASWGEQFKEESIKYYTQSLSIGGMAETSPHKNNYLDLSTDYNDIYGKALVQMTFNFHNQDYARFEFLNNRCEEIMTAMGADSVEVKPTPENYDIVPYQFTHNAGGTIMGADPESSVVNNWLQHWDRDNLFAVSAGSYAHMSGYNATLTVGALAYRCAEGIIEYSKSPGRLES
ncbi:MAG: GMC family oxidoreductase, partial [Jeotgalicoccus halophilus]|nr:GMC family oxidoreductase [Jeotgalicoccus aerolatus]